MRNPRRGDRAHEREPSQVVANALEQPLPAPEQRRHEVELHLVALEIRGTPHALHALAAAATAGAWPLPPFGTLFLDPLVLQVRGGGALDAEGRALVELAIPTDPAAIGTTPHFQSLVGSAPPRLTNRESVTVTGW